MLTKLRVKNFKAWGEELWNEGVELAPITLFLGPNSAGKTSLLQVPLLLKQTFTSPDPNLDLNLGGQATDLVDLGTFESVIHGNDTSRELGVGVSLKLPFQAPMAYLATFSGSGLAASLRSLELSWDDRTVVANRQNTKSFALVASYSQRAIVDIHGPSRSIAFSPHTRLEPDAVATTVQEASFLLQSAIERIAYLGPLRDAPARSYLWTGARPGDLGSRGERAVAALLASIDEAEEGKGDHLVESVSRWMKKLGIADELVIERHGRSRYHELFVISEGRKTNIMDVGFGISQVLPMLVLAHFVPEGTTIIAEQPEIHLHPRAQVGLAELMVEVARERKVQFVVETHSEHLFRRLQTLISEEKLGHDECRLYFVDRDDKGKTQLTNLEMDAYGRVKNWPKHFFGDAIGETERQTRKMLERVARERGKR